MEIRDLLAVLLRGEPLSRDAAAGFFAKLLAGELSEPQIAAALALMQSRGVTLQELAAGAESMQRHVRRVPIENSLTGHLIDTCGTGGAPKTFNISTLAAITTAAAAPGIARVAKHGGKSRTGRGSADILRELGVNVDASPETQASCLKDLSLCFSFAVHHHPAMRYATPVRMALGFPTIFNLLGPLTNPAGANRQVMGVYAPHLVELIAGVLADRGCERAMVLHSSDGLDELSIHAPTRIAHVRSGSVVSIETFDPSPLVPSPGDPALMVAQDLPGAVRMARSVLAGEPGPCSDAVALNAAAALVVADAAGSIKEGFAMARSALSTGAAARTLEALARLSRLAGP